MLQASCKLLMFVHLYLLSCNYFWMLCEGIYLHTLIVVAVFAKKQHLLWYYLLGWGEWSLFPTGSQAKALLQQRRHSSDWTLQDSPSFLPFFIPQLAAVTTTTSERSPRFPIFDSALPECGLGWLFSLVGCLPCDQIS